MATTQQQQHQGGAGAGKRKPVFVKVDQLKPGTSGHTLTAMVLTSETVLHKGRAAAAQLRPTRIAECLIGDETGTIVFTARNEQGGRRRGAIKSKETQQLSAGRGRGAMTEDKKEGGYNKREGQVEKAKRIRGRRKEAIVSEEARRLSVGKEAIREVEGWWGRGTWRRRKREGTIRRKERGNKQREGEEEGGWRRGFWVQGGLKVVSCAGELWGRRMKERRVLTVEQKERGDS
ncbi:hypothetical protein BHE74_00007254 [Ensete ventricosum]|nr:hypothetical protein BHE74_00007254 [Ensete ventricosum]